MCNYSALYYITFAGGAFTLQLDYAVHLSALSNQFPHHEKNIYPIKLCELHTQFSVHLRNTLRQFSYIIYTSEKFLLIYNFLTVRFSDFFHFFDDLITLKIHNLRRTGTKLPEIHKNRYNFSPLKTSEKSINLIFFTHSSSSLPRTNLSPLYIIRQIKFPKRKIPSKKYPKTANKRAKFTLFPEPENGM